MNQADPTTNRYLDLVKIALLDELYLENELRIDYLLEVIDKAIPLDTERVRDPFRNMRIRADRLRAERRSGKRPTPEADDVADYFPFTTMGRPRLDHLQQCIEQLREDAIAGALVDCGTGRGGAAILMKACVEAFELTEATIWIADRFRATAEEESDGTHRGLPTLLADLNAVRDGFARFGLLDDRVRFVQGRFEDTLEAAETGPIALLRIGGQGEDVHTILDALYDRVVPGGFVVIDDYASASTAERTDAFRERQAIDAPLARPDWSGVSWRKDARPQPVRSSAGTRAVPSKDLSMVVVFFDMRREAARTLLSLSRSYQRDIQGVDYEVVVVENGSPDSGKLDPGYVESFGPEFRYVDMGTSATTSPVEALNRGIGLASGRAFGLMIDGAHVLTPGVLRFGMTGLRTYAPAIVATQQWYVGPGQQPDIMLDGYDQEYEDGLFDGIAWPSDGYRLFDIGHFIGDRDWLDGLWESNCLFVPRELVEQVGSFDTSFSMAGGGYANLELYERLGSTPGVTSVTILGEGSFHQVHGGTTTNAPDVDQRHGRLASYSDHFKELRGRRFRGHGKPTHYVGTMRPNTLRSRPRRQTAASFFKPRKAEGADGVPATPVPVPQDLKEDVIEAFWNSLAWRQPTWLGQRVQRPPSDLFVYQELLARLRPDWVVETGTGTGGRALFLACICELIGHGKVLSISHKESDQRPQHERIHYLTGMPHDPATGAEVRAIVGDGATCLVILGSHGSRQRTLAEFDLYSPLVQVGSYVIVEDTIVNGHPVWTGFGPGPLEAVKGIINRRTNFSPDGDLERYLVTFNPLGFLKRVR